MFEIHHPSCTSEAGKRAELTPHSATFRQPVLSIRAQLIDYKRYEQKHPITLNDLMNDQ